MTRNVVMRKVITRRSDYQIILKLSLCASLDNGLRATRAWGTADRPSALTWILPRATLYLGPSGWLCMKVDAKRCSDFKDCRKTWIAIA